MNLCLGVSTESGAVIASLVANSSSSPTGSTPARPEDVVGHRAGRGPRPRSRSRVPACATARPDPPETDDPEAPPTDPMDGGDAVALTAGSACHTVRARQPARRRQEQEHRMVGHLIHAVVGDVGEPDPGLVAARHR